MGGPEMAPHTPQRSERPGEAVTLFDMPMGDWNWEGAEPPSEFYAARPVSSLSEVMT